jgi:hypothetical protein
MELKHQDTYNKTFFYSMCWISLSCNYHIEIYLLFKFVFRRLYLFL